VALGHIHKSQNLNEGVHPPVIYPGSIERVDFGEAADDKFFVMAQVDHGYTQVEWRKLAGRRFIDRYTRITDADDFQHQALQALPPRSELQDAIVRLVLEYPHDWDAMFNEAELRQAADNAFEFHLVRRPQVEARLRMPGDQTLSSLTPLDLLGRYWVTLSTEPEETDNLQKLAGELLGFDGQDQTHE
jgi:exonuclease SbcD